MRRLAATTKKKEEFFTFIKAQQIKEWTGRFYHHDTLLEHCARLETKKQTKDFTEWKKKQTERIFILYMCTIYRFPVFPFSVYALFSPKSNCCEMRVEKSFYGLCHMYVYISFFVWIFFSVFAINRKRIDKDEKHRHCRCSHTNWYKLCISCK